MLRTECAGHIGDARLFGNHPASTGGSSNDDSGKPATTGVSLSIDRSGLFHVQPHSHSPAVGKEPETDMCKHIKALIQVQTFLYKHALHCKSTALFDFGITGSHSSSEAIPLFCFL